MALCKQSWAHLFWRTSIIMASAVSLMVAACRTNTAAIHQPAYVPYPEGISDEGKIYVDFGATYRSGYLKGRTHDGIDIRGRTRQPIHAIADGVVVTRGNESCAGPTLVIDHGRDLNGERLVAYSLHLGDCLVDGGQHVKRGDIVAYLGEPEPGFLCWRGRHLHLELSNHIFGINQLYRAPAKNPHLLWADGPYRPACFEPDRDDPEGTMTYPMLCDYQIHTIDDVVDPTLLAPS